MQTAGKFTEDGFLYEPSQSVSAGVVWERWRDAGDKYEFTGRAVVSAKADKKQVVGKFKQVDRRLGRDAFSGGVR